MKTPKLTFRRATETKEEKKARKKREKEAAGKATNGEVEGPKPSKKRSLQDMDSMQVDGEVRKKKKKTKRAEESS